MIIRELVIAAIVAVVIFGVYEVRLWTRPDYVSARQRRIRVAGFCFLIVSLALWLHGTYLPVPQTHGHFPTRALKVAALCWVAYWTITFLALIPLIPLALLDTRENLKRASEERRKMLREALTVHDGPEKDDPPRQGQQGHTSSFPQGSDSRPRGPSPLPLPEAERGALGTTTDSYAQDSFPEGVCASERPLLDPNGHSERDSCQEGVMSSLSADAPSEDPKP